MTAKQQDKAMTEVASYLEMTPDQRETARAHAATLAKTAARVAIELPLTADVDDFGRVLAARAAQ
jgi:hypothetical protein